MSLSVPANGGNGLTNLFRQARQVKTAEDRTSSSEPAAAAVSLRPAGQSGIDSTGSGTAQMSAALTLYMSDLGGSDDAPATAEAVPASERRAPPKVSSGAADLLRVLDAYSSAA